MSGTSLGFILLLALEAFHFSDFIPTAPQNLFIEVNTVLTTLHNHTQIWQLIESLKP